jgi:hypothetical protein
MDGTGNIVLSEVTQVQTNVACFLSPVEAQPIR